jgi:hypothetical protein
VQLSYDMTRTDQETLPPSAPDYDVAEFESDVRERGESSARWDRLMVLLAEREAQS